MGKLKLRRFLKTLDKIVPSPKLIQLSRNEKKQLIFY